MGRANRRGRSRGGRPPAGFRPGERVRDYPQLSVRVPPRTKLRLGALSVLLSKPQWRIVLESIELLIGSLPESDQRMLKDLLKRRGSRGHVRHVKS
jgi:predicted DNA-binding protein